ncbi:unnamed protein product [Somion occarium]|uniref:Uncharacterized protein n=1 Tax=Somion occarium TaxID=3059160 RepID=A0ABP1CY32_9APHY
MPMSNSRRRCMSSNSIPFVANTSSVCGRSSFVGTFKLAFHALSLRLITKHVRSQRSRGIKHCKLWPHDWPCRTNAVDRNNSLHDSVPASNRPNEIHPTTVNHQGRSFIEPLPLTQLLIHHEPYGQTSPQKSTDIRGSPKSTPSWGKNGCLGCHESLLVRSLTPLHLEVRQTSEKSVAIVTAYTGKAKRQQFAA